MFFEKNIKVFVIDDHEVVITGITAVLSKNKDINIIGTASNYQEALQKINTKKPDVIIMDIMLPEISGIELAKEILQKYPDVKIIFHTSFVDEKNVVEGFEVGAMGFVPKNFKVEELVEAINTVYEGKKYVKGIVSQIVIDSLMKSKTETEKETEKLSEREKEIVKYIAMGYVNKEIADKLKISQRTVEAHKSNILKKLKLSTKADLIIYAIKKGIINI